MLSSDDSTLSNALKSLPQEPDADWAFQRYESVKHRLPEARFPQKSQCVQSLADLTERFDAFVFDSFGVLNVGGRAIPQAAPRVEALRQLEKRLVILTNAATTPLDQLPDKYSALGFAFERSEIVSSRDVFNAAIARFDKNMTWGVLAPESSQVSETPARTIRIGQDDANLLGQVDGVVLLSSQDISLPLFDALLDKVSKDRPPVLVGNPDLVAPREYGCSLEPGSYAHRLADLTGIEPQFFGKPFGNAFDGALERLPDGLDKSRIAMVGDTLHTDILGGAAAGFGTVLVTADGVLKDLDVDECIKKSGIVPDFIAPTI